MTRKVPSAAAQVRMLELLRTCGLVIAGPDQRVLRHLELRRHVRALPLYDPRSGKPTMARAWQITDVGIAAALRLEAIKPRRRARPEVVQIDIEEAIAASSGERPVSLPLPVSDAPAVAPAGVSAPRGRSVGTGGSCRPGARGTTPETVHA